MFSYTLNTLTITSFVDIKNYCGLIMNGSVQTLDIMLGEVT